MNLLKENSELKRKITKLKQEIASNLTEDTKEFLKPHLDISQLQDEKMKLDSQIANKEQEVVQLNAEISGEREKNDRELVAVRTVTNKLEKEVENLVGIVDKKHSIIFDQIKSINEFKKEELSDIEKSILSKKKLIEDQEKTYQDSLTSLEQKKTRLESWESKLKSKENELNTFKGQLEERLSKINKKEIQVEDRLKTFNMHLPR